MIIPAQRPEPGQSIYNDAVNSAWLEDIQDFLGFDDEDLRRIRRLAVDARPLVAEVVEAFYRRILQHPSARAVFTDGEAQIRRQRDLLAAWLDDLLDANIGPDYLVARVKIGTTHVTVGLPPRFMVLGMEIIWSELAAGLRRRNRAISDEDLVSLHKLFQIDLCLMLESYKEGFSDAIRAGERAAMEEKLTRAQHLAEIGQLAASLAHEIKNPLAGISGAIQIIGDAMTSDNPHRPIIQEVLGQINRLDAAVKDLLLYARPMAPRLRPTRLDELVPRVLTVLREEPTLQRMHVQYNCPQPGIVVQADEAQMEQLLINLLLNAAQASEPGANIYLQLRQTAGVAELAVRDDGAGMPRDVVERAEEPFFTTKARGTGLGLPICRRIVEAHGGTMKLKSVENQGTTVCITLKRSNDSQS